MTAQEWVLLIGAIGTLVGTITASAIAVIRALKANTDATVAHTAAVTGEPPAGTPQ